MEEVMTLRSLFGEMCALVQPGALLFVWYIIHLCVWLVTSIFRKLQPVLGDGINKHIFIVDHLCDDGRSRPGVWFFDQNGKARCFLVEDFEVFPSDKLMAQAVLVA